MNCTDAANCVNGDYVCPISKVCVHGAEGYLECPQLKGTHLDWNLTLEERINFLIKNLSLNEKYPQLANEAQPIPRLGMPFYNYRSNDIHSILGASHSTVFPDGCGLGSTWSKNDMFNVSYIIAFEQRSLHNYYVHNGNRNPNDGGALTNNGPNINLVRDPRWGRSQEVYSEDPRLTGHLAYYFLTGMQYGKDIQTHIDSNIDTNKNTKGSTDESYWLMGSQCKHYAVYDLESIPESRLKYNAITDAVNWAETYSPVFRECITRAKAAQVMCSYNAINGVPACANNYSQNVVLRDQWGFEGYVVSDYDAMEGIYNQQHYANSSLYALVYGLKGGCDMEGGGTTAISNVPTAINMSLITIDDINTALSRIMRARIKLGMFDPPTFVEYNKWGVNTSEIEDNAHLDYARLIAAKSVCLYKNENNALPLVLSEDIGKTYKVKDGYRYKYGGSIKGIAMIGLQAISTNLLIGNYASYPDKGIETILQAFRQEIEGVNYNNSYQNCVNVKSNTIFQMQANSLNNDNIINTDTYTSQECCNLCFNVDFCYYWIYNTSQTKCYLLTQNSINPNATMTSNDHISGQCNMETKEQIIEKSIIKTAVGCNTIACSDKSNFTQVIELLNNMNKNGTLSHIFIGLGLSQSQESEGRDRSVIELPGYQYDLVNMVYNYTKQNSITNVPIICYIIHGGTVALQNVKTQCDAIVDLWYPGQMGALGFADVALGNYNPAGRASVTSYISTNVLPNMGDQNEYPNNNSSKYGITYRYFTNRSAIDIPFGYGLSYTTFKYSNLSLNITQSTKSRKHKKYGYNAADYTLSDPCGIIKISFDITNTGMYDGDEVAQAYIIQTNTSVPVPNIRLGDFSRVNMIKVNETRNVQLILTPRYRSVVYNKTSPNWYTPNIQIESGLFTIYVGGGQPGDVTTLQTTVDVTNGAALSSCGNQN